MSTLLDKHLIDDPSAAVAVSDVIHRLRKAGLRIKKDEVICAAQGRLTLVGGQLHISGYRLA